MWALHVNYSKITIIATLFAVTALVFPSASTAAVQCDFTRDLELGDVGEDVRCLQRYLNDAGIIVSPSGVGAPGRETNQFKALTKEAVVKWQIKNSIVPASGYFGPLSKAKYQALASGTTAGTNSADALKAQAAALTEELNRLRANNANAGSGSVTPPPNTVGEAEARKQLSEAVEMLEQAVDQIDDGQGDTNRAKADLDDAFEDFLYAVASFLRGNYELSAEAADDAYDNALDSFETAGGLTREDEIDDFIDEVEDDIEAAEEQIDAAGDDGDDTEEAEELLEEAEETLDRAKDALDDGEYDEAENLAEEAEDLADDAVDAIGNNSERDEAEDAIEDAEDAIDDARDAIEEADDDGEDVDDAEDLLEEAEEKLEDAEDAYDDEDYDDAIELAEEAEDLANEAEDEL